MSCRRPALAALCFLAAAAAAEPAQAQADREAAVDFAVCVSNVHRFLTAAAARDILAVDRAWIADATRHACAPLESAFVADGRGAFLPDPAAIAAAIFETIVRSD